MWSQLKTIVEVLWHRQGLNYFSASYRLDFKPQQGELYRSCMADKERADNAIQVIRFKQIDEKNIPKQICCVQILNGPRERLQSFFCVCKRIAYVREGQWGIV